MVADAREHRSGSGQHNDQSTPKSALVLPVHSRTLSFESLKGDEGGEGVLPSPLRARPSPIRIDGFKLDPKDKTESGGLSAKSSASVKSALSTRSWMSTRSSVMTVAQRRCITCLAIFCHMLSGLTIVIVNKKIVHDNGLHAPALVSSTGALFTAAFTRLLVFLGKVTVRDVGDKPWEFVFRRALPVGVFAAGSLCFGNMSYIYLDAGLVQMLKAGTPALLLAVLTILRVEQISCSTAGLALVMVFGSGLACLQQPNATVFGLAIQLVSQLCEVLQCTAMQIFLQHLGFEAWDAGYYLAPAVAACCLLPSLVLEWPQVIASHKVGVLYENVPLLVLSGTIGIVVNFSNTFVIKFTSSLLAKLLVIARSSALVMVFIISGEPFTYLQVVGYAITLSAFAGFSVVKAREIEAQARADEERASRELENEAFDSEDELLEAPSPTASSIWDESKQFDLTGSMFWFSIFVVLAGCYQATIIGDVPTPCGFFERALTAARYETVSSGGMPPTPYLEPIVAGLQTRHWDAIEKRASSWWEERGDRSLAGGALSVESAAKVLFLSDGRFVLHANDDVVLGFRRPEEVLSTSWLVSSKQFGMVHLSALDNMGQITWLSCNLRLAFDWADACLFWMTAPHWDQWSSDMNGQYIFRRAAAMHGGSGSGTFVAVSGTRLAWSDAPTTFQVMDWMPEVCPFVGMAPSTVTYQDAVGEVTFTMTTFFHIYARSVMFRQAFSSMMKHIKEQDIYIKEFLVTNDWYKGRSLAFNGTYTGPDVAQTRQEMLTFFPGCVGASTSSAKQRPLGQKCTFVFQSEHEYGLPKALNHLFDLMVTKFWIHFEDDYVLYQDVYPSRLLSPMFDHPESCWRSQGSECLKITGVRLLGKPLTQALEGDFFEVEQYKVPEVFFDSDYVEAYLAHGGFDNDRSHDWGQFSKVGAVAWPSFSLQPSLHNLTYIKSLEAPLLHGGRPARFSESPSMTTWRDRSHTYTFDWDVELEFAIRWARGGGTFAFLSPGVCMRDVSNGITSFERSRGER